METSRFWLRSRKKWKKLIVGFVIVVGGVGVKVQKRKTYKKRW